MKYCSLYDFFCRFCATLDDFLQVRVLVGLRVS